MGGNSTGPWVISATLALFAAVLGSLVTLVITDSIKVPDVNSGEPVAALSSGDGSSSVGSSSTAKLQFSENLANAPDFELADETLEQLRQSVQDAAAERSQLAQSIARLTTQIDDLQSDAINVQSLNDLAQLSENDAPQDEAQPAAPRLTRAERRANALVAAGVDESTAQALLSSQDQYQLARLELVDQAEREGWADSEQFDQQLGQLDEQRLDLRAELGDEAYDQYLYEAGRNNRVVIQSVIPGSEAESAGLQIGDAVLNYANERIFSTRELQQATREGSRGELIDVAVERQGQSLFLDVARGPLGVTLSADKQDPGS